MKQIYDFIVIGGGISGATMAYFLKDSGFRVLLLEKNTLASGGSGAAGAFLSPKICSNSSYTAFVNKAFNFSVKFYQDNFPLTIRQKGILRILKNEKDKIKCKNPPKEIEKVQFLKQNEIKHINKDIAPFGGYFFKDGAIIDSKKVILGLIKDIDVRENSFIKEIKYKNDMYEIGSYKSEGIVVCTGSDVGFEGFEYIKVKKTYGHRVDIKTDIKLPFHLHKNYSISSNENSTIHIGATHLPKYKYDKYEAKKVLDCMIQEASSYIKLKDFRITKVHFGERSCSFDFFPIVGQMINHKKTLERYPYIKKGSKIPSSKYIYFKNLYIHTAHGARGFVLSPYTAYILVRFIKEKIKIPSDISTKRLFLKFARK